MMGVSALSNAASLEEGDPAAVMALLGPAMGIVAVIGLVCLGFLLWIGLAEGQSGENRYGANPKG